MVGARLRWTDLVVTALLLLFAFAGTGPAAVNQGSSVPPLAYALAGAACLPIAVRAYRPLWTLLGTGTLTLLYLLLGFPYGPIMITLLVAVLGSTLRLPIRTTLVAGGALVLGGLVVIGVGVLLHERHSAELLSVGAWLLVPGAIGAAVKVRRDATEDVRAEQARRVISEERLQLAQEVHDVAGHGFAVIAMQAGVALRVLERDPAAAREALRGIRAASREALDSLRAEIETLRLGTAADAPLRPHPGLADLPALVERIRDSGLPVEFSLDGVATADPPAEVDRAAYRIVQEALTNVLRHGGPAATVRVQVGRVADALNIEVADTGRGTVATPDTGGSDTGGRDTGGRGIEGMRDRAEALGGTLSAGPRPEGGFVVRASLPLGGSS